MDIYCWKSWGTKKNIDKKYQIKINEQAFNTEV